MTAMRKYVTLLLTFTISGLVYADSINGRKVKWLDDDKEVYVLQDKEFTKKGKFVFSLGYVDNLDVAFQQTRGFKGDVSYYLSETWSLELGYRSYSNSNNSDLKNVENLPGVNVKPLVRRPTSMLTFGGAWSPLYGKINVFNNIVYFDMGAGLYYTKLEAESNVKTFGDSGQPLIFDPESFNGFMGKAFFRIYINETWNVGYEYSITTFSAPISRDEDVNQKEERDYITDMAITFGVMF